MNAIARRRLALVVSLVVAGGVLLLLATGIMGRNIVYYWTPTQLLEAGAAAQGARIRLGGMVAAGSLQWNPEALQLSFQVEDDAHRVAVQASGTPPEMFREGIGAVVEGTMGPDGVFQASRLLVSHNNEYRAPTDGSHGDDPFKSVEGL